MRGPSLSDGPHIRDRRKMNRRRFLQLLAAAAASAAWPADASQKRLPLGIQLYMLGEDVQDRLEQTLLDVASIGFREIELPGLYGRKGAELRAAIAAAGLDCPSVHAFIEALEAPGAIDAALALGARHVVIPGFPVPLAPERLAAGESFAELLAETGARFTADDWKRLADRMNRIGARARERGLRLGYHNHNPELRIVEAGKTALELLIEYTDPDLVSFEIDVGWIAAAGADPAAFIRRHGGRIAQLHLKDLAGTPPNLNLRMNPADVGSGVIDWRDVLDAAAEAGVAHYYVEQEPPFQGPRIEAARAAYAFLTGERFGPMF